MAAFLEGQVRFLIVGGYAFGAHAFIRATKDIDLWIDPTSENARRVWNALAAFGAPLIAHGITQADFEVKKLVYQIGNEPQRIDIITSIADIDFGEAWERRLDAELDGLMVPVLGLQDLIHAKVVAGRKQDMLDIHALQRVAQRPT